MIFPAIHHVRKKSEEKIVRITLSSTPGLKWIVKHRDGSITFFYELMPAIKDWFLGIFRRKKVEEQF